jgi:hypothetical protein
VLRGEQLHERDPAGAENLDRVAAVGGDRRGVDDEADASVAEGPSSLGVDHVEAHPYRRSNSAGEEKEHDAEPRANLRPA